MRIAAFSLRNAISRLKPIPSATVAIVLLLVSACESTFVSTWKSPDAKPLELRSEKVAAVVMMKDQESRRRAEDTLAQAITSHGAQGVAMYTLVPDANPSNEPATRAALEKAAVRGIVVMRLMSIDNQLKVKPVTQLDPTYGGYWDGYYATGRVSPYTATPVTIGTDIQSTTTVYVETLVYSLKQNKLVWSGQSKTVDPPKLEGFIKQLTEDVARELREQGVIKK